jgi:hypothetical protein
MIAFILFDKMATVALYKTDTLRAADFSLRFASLIKKQMVFISIVYPSRV